MPGGRWSSRLLAARSPGQAGESPQKGIYQSHDDQAETGDRRSQLTSSALTISYGINGLNQITNVNGTNFGYDTRGNLSGDGSGTTYTYNLNNLLISAVQSAVTTTLGYDPSSRQLSIAKSGFGTTQFLYDGSDPSFTKRFTGSF